VNRPAAATIGIGGQFGAANILPFGRRRGGVSRSGLQPVVHIAELPRARQWTERARDQPHGVAFHDWN
jgi:hypothetical protein